MNNELRKGLFAIDDTDPDYIEGFTDGSTWNGWSKPIFTADNLKKVFHPYIVEFSFTEDEIPQAVIDIETSIEVIESSPVWDGKEFLIGYAPEGFCFIEKDVTFQ